MDCDTCAWKEGCLIRKTKGNHLIDDCEEYFPDLKSKRTRKPQKIKTPEDLKPSIETRENMT